MNIELSTIPESIASTITPGREPPCILNIWTYFLEFNTRVIRDFIYVIK